jgi:hypothetical protein
MSGDAVNVKECPVGMGMTDSLSTNASYGCASETVLRLTKKQKNHKLYTALSTLKTGCGT